MFCDVFQRTWTELMLKFITITIQMCEKPAGESD